MLSNQQPPFFSVHLTGQIESAYLPEYDNLYCKFGFEYGPDWTGIEEGISQFAKQYEQTTWATSGPVKPCVWNFPFDVSFKSTNFYGWPQLVVTVYGLDQFGRDVVRGYGSFRLPTKQGTFTEYVPVFVPVATSPFNQLYGWLLGRLPEFIDSKFPAKHTGREITRRAVDT
ncbi:B9 domain-containing protein [Gorgonomyces haynaldii]|nr:B9 domain-containing protein [Gorgonomyces haynaldii]